MTGVDLDWNEVERPRRTAGGGRGDQLPAGGGERRSDWDYFPGHFDPTYARSQGNPTIYVNTMHLAGFADRIATDWAGPGSRVVRRQMRLAGSVYAGDTMVGRGRAVAKRLDTSVDPPRLPRRHPDHRDQSARRLVLPGRAHPAAALISLSSSIFPLQSTEEFPSSGVRLGAATVISLLLLT